MKMRIAIVILILACAGLLIALLAAREQTDTQRKKDAGTILDFSNQWVSANNNLDDLRQVNLMLTNDLEATRQALTEASNQLIETSDTLSNAQAAYQTAQGEITNLNGRIADLESQNQELDQRAAQLTSTISNLTDQITDTRQKLADSETNNVFLAQEIKRQLAEKAEWERKFNTLSVVRAQVRTLKGKLEVARRVEWMREGVYANTQEKGAQRLMQRTPPPRALLPRPEHYDLNVEVGSDGSVRVIPALTNAPAITNSPQ
jgi:chromosome segregation ATPase